MVSFTILLLCVVLVLVPKIYCENQLAQLAEDFYGGNSPETERKSSDPGNYVPLYKKELCLQSPAKFNSCDKHISRKILIVDQLPVMATQLGCGKRMYHFMEALIGLDFDINFAYLRPDPLETPVDKSLMKRLGVTVSHSPLLMKNIKVEYKELVDSVQPDIIVMTLWYWQADKLWFNVPGLLMIYTKRNYPNTKIIIMTDDFHWYRLRSIAMHRNAAAMSDGPSGEGAAAPVQESIRDMSALRIHEYKAYSDADAVMVISETDQALILRHDTKKMLHNSSMSRPAGKLFVVPFVASPWETAIRGIDEAALDSTTTQTFTSFTARKGLIFVGNLKNPTNVEGLSWFFTKIMPLIVRHIPDLTVTIVGGGKWPLKNIPPVTPIRWMGWLSWEQLQFELSVARVFISPIVASTGVNTKNSLAMSSGVPLVTTRIGAAGLCASCHQITTSLDEVLDTALGGGILIPELGCTVPFLCGVDETDFARGVLELYNDEMLWNTYSRAGLRNVAEYLSVEKEAIAIETMFDYVT